MIALAAKKLVKQGEEVVSVDPKAAFPAATVAVALWGNFPDFGKLLLAYVYETCPFLLPYHPVQKADQSGEGNLCSFSNTCILLTND